MRTRNRHLSVWMNEQEYRHLRAQAELAGMGIDPFIRSIVSGVQLRPRPPDQRRGLLNIRFAGALLRVRPICDLGALVADGGRPA